MKCILINLLTRFAIGSVCVRKSDSPWPILSHRTRNTTWAQPAPPSVSIIPLFCNWGEKAMINTSLSLDGERINQRTCHNLTNLSDSGIKSENGRTAINLTSSRFYPRPFTVPPARTAWPTTIKRLHVGFIWVC